MYNEYNSSLLCEEVFDRYYKIFSDFGCKGYFNNFMLCDCRKQAL